MRRPRIDLPPFPLHVTHRGVNRAGVFIDDMDRRTYLAAMAAGARKCGVSVHGYVLMGNHVHLLLAGQEAGAVSRMMQALGRRFVKAYNARWARTGTLWEGRFRSCVVDSDRYVLNCLAYIELNPVRAGLVSAAADYAWSSARFHLGLRRDASMTLHPSFVALACEDQARARAWSDVLGTPVADEDLAAIREHTRQERAWGSEEFRSSLEAKLGRPVSLAAPGRPRTGV